MAVVHVITIDMATIKPEEPGESGLFLCPPFKFEGKARVDLNQVLAAEASVA
jgi:hypothetical protein